MFKSEQEVAVLKEAISFSFKGPKGEQTLKFIEKFCGVWDGGPGKDLSELQYAQGRRDVALTILTLLSDAWSPEQIFNHYKKQGS